MKNLAHATLFAAFIASAAAAHAAAPAYILTATQSSDRPSADAKRDAARHPAALIAFAGLKPGDAVADIMPGGGYFTRIFANVVGQQGHVYAIIPSEFAAVKKDAADGIKSLAAEPAFNNVTPVVTPTAQTGAGEHLDMAWTSDNYHDIYGFFGPQQAAALDEAVFRALKPGGVFIVIDHVAPAGTSATSPTTLHRIDPATVKAQMEAAGFKLEAESSILTNPADPHTAKVFAPEIRGKTDQFVFKFRKPTQ
jgi:predicted methyltransferase